jgi:hypothetical protein
MSKHVQPVSRTDVRDRVLTAVRNHDIDQRRSRLRWRTGSTGYRPLTDAERKHFLALLNDRSIRMIHAGGHRPGHGNYEIVPDGEPF